MNSKIFYFVCVLTYGMVVASATYYVHRRQCDEIRVNKTLTVNDKIAAKDLLPDQLHWIDKYARHDIKEGSVLRDEDVSLEKLPVKETQPRLIAEISMLRPTAEKGVSAGDKVRLCVSDVVATPDGVTVSNALCSESTCRLTISSDELPKVLMKLKGDLEGLRAVPDSGNCK